LGEGEKKYEAKGKGRINKNQRWKAQGFGEWQEVPGNWINIKHTKGNCS
jgi:hypothetical protein